MPRLLAPLLLAAFALPAVADDPDPRALADAVVKAAGGKDALPSLFRFKEKLIVGSDPKAKPSDRTSVLEPPTYWWVGKRERVKEDKEPATYLVWAWTLRPLVDAKSKLKVAAEVKEGDRPAFGLEVSGTIDPPMTMYFDKETKSLVRIDWRADVHRFSEHKRLGDFRYPARCVGYKKSSGKAWYFSDLVEVERLKELPEGLKR